MPHCYVLQSTITIMSIMYPPLNRNLTPMNSEVASDTNRKRALFSIATLYSGVEYNDTEYNGLLLFLVECMINYVQDCYKMCCHDGSGIFYHLKQKIISMVFISEHREKR